MASHGWTAAVATTASRSATRSACDLPAEIHLANHAGLVAARCRDLGSAGACITTASPFPLAAARRVVIALPSGPICVEVRGRWQQRSAGASATSGLAFGAAPAPAAASLARFVRDRSLQLARFLREQAALRELALEQVVWLVERLRFRHVPSGDPIYLQDQDLPGDDGLFVVAEGRVALSGRAPSGDAVTITTLGAGEIFGGTPLLANVSHAESARAEGDCLLLELRRNAFQHLQRVRPRLAQALSRAATRAYTARLQGLLRSIRYHA